MIELICYSLLCLIIMRILHLCYCFLKTNYTTKKIKCSKQFQDENYLAILNELKNTSKRLRRPSYLIDEVTNTGYIPNHTDSLYQYAESVLETT